MCWCTAGNREWTRLPSSLLTQKAVFTHGNGNIDNSIMGMGSLTTNFVVGVRYKINNMHVQSSLMSSETLILRRLKPKVYYANLLPY